MEITGSAAYKRQFGKQLFGHAYPLIKVGESVSKHQIKWAYSCLDLLDYPWRWSVERVSVHDPFFNLAVGINFGVQLHH